MILPLLCRPLSKKLCMCARVGACFLLLRLSTTFYSEAYQICSLFFGCSGHTIIIITGTNLNSISGHELLVNLRCPEAVDYETFPESSGSAAPSGDTGSVVMLVIEVSSLSMCSSRSSCQKGAVGGAAAGRRGAQQQEE